MPDLLTTADVAKLSGVPLSTVRRWKRTGWGPTPAVTGQRTFYERSDVLGWLMTRKTPPTDTERFLAKASLDEATGCLNWTASLDRKGYGFFRWNGRPARAHRFAYETFIGKIPDGLEIDHTCRNRACVNPEHLEPVTHAENLRRGRNAHGR